MNEVIVTEPVGSAGRAVLRKAAFRILPLLGLGYGLAYIDRLNISFAALEMNRDLRFSATVYGIGAGLFFLSYALCEIPANLILVRIGARRWIGQILMAWGAISAAMMFVNSPWEFYLLRFLLGAAEAGFFPGAVFYLSAWFPAEYRGRAISGFFISYPIASALMGVTAGAILNMKGMLGLAGWQWLFLLEGVPAVLLGLVVLIWLADRPRDAAWLSGSETDWLESQLDQDTSIHFTIKEVFDVIVHPVVLLLGAINFLLLGTYYAFNFSAPLIVKSATGMSATEVGYIFSGAGIAGIGAMLAAGWLSDIYGERLWFAASLICVSALGFALLGVATTPSIAVAAFLIAAVSNFATQGIMWAIPGDLIRGRPGAIAVAGIIAIGVFGSFLSPIAWGQLHDATGGYRIGISLLPVPMLIAAGLLVCVRLWVQRRQPLTFDQANDN
jgi:MFS transporter, ACS family, tartrate transporter